MKSNYKEKESYKCQQCDRTFNDENKLTNHKRENHYTFKYSCPECGNGFNQKHNLNLHRKSHSDKHELHIKCTLCDIYFKTESQLSNHTMKQHPRNFNTQANLKRGEDLEPEAQQYNCMECDHQTTEKFKLRKHMELAHKASTSQFKFKCKDCAQEIQRMWSLRNH